MKWFWDAVQRGRGRITIIKKIKGDYWNYQREEEGADSDGNDEVGDVSVGDILLWLCDPQ